MPDRGAKLTSRPNAAYFFARQITDKDQIPLCASAAVCQRFRADTPAVRFAKAFDIRGHVTQQLVGRDIPAQGINQVGEPICGSGG